MLFLSYSWADAVAAHAIADVLRSAGLPTWLDVTDLNTARDIEPQLINGIVGTTFFLHLDSDNSRRSRWVTFERHVATATNRLVFDVAPYKMANAVTQLPHNHALHTEPRAARFLNSMSFTAAR
jgi:hypothetical protein